MGPPIHLNVVHIFVLLTALQLMKVAINWIIGATNLTNTDPGRAVHNVYAA